MSTPIYMHQISTVKKLAGILLLSVSAVSRAFEDHPDISGATKKKVNERTVPLDYEPDTFAINLRNNTNNVLMNNGFFN